MATELAGEEQPGPILSIMSARKFELLFLFHTPHTRANVFATTDEVRRRYPDCKISTHELPVPDPKDYSSLMSSLARQLRDLKGSLAEPSQANATCDAPMSQPSSGLPTTEQIQQLMKKFHMQEAQARSAFHELSDGITQQILMRGWDQSENYICVSSGTAEMRAAWFLLTATGYLPAKLLQVGSPARPLFGAPSVKEVRLDMSNWRDLRDLMLPMRYFSSRAHTALENRARELVGTAKESLNEWDWARLLETAQELQRIAAEIVSAEQRARRPESAPGLNQVNWARLLELETAQDVRRITAEIVSPGQRARQPESTPGLDEALQELGIFIGSALMRNAAEEAAIAADSTCPVLLLGETGTGKERFANLIHRLSPRHDHQYLAINCASIPKELAESYLFGHVKGAFTGAATDKKGVFEDAHQTTLFLDEIAELTLDIQAKLLRVLQDGVVQRVGSTASHKVDVRIIAATNRDLLKEVREGRFRDDLYYRLEVVPIKLPPLRERRNEIPELALALLQRINQQRKNPRRLSTDALKRLEGYDWPGNVRQLTNVLERSVLFAQSDVLGSDDLILSDAIPASDPFAGLPDPAPGFSLPQFVDRIRKQLILRALAKCNNNRTEAANLLGISKQAVSQFCSGEAVNAD